MSMDTSTALACYKSAEIMAACIYKGKGKEDFKKLLEPYLVEVYEGLLWTYNYNPEYIVNEKAKSNSISVASLNECIQSS